MRDDGGLERRARRERERKRGRGGERERKREREIKRKRGHRGVSATRPLQKALSSSPVGTRDELGDTAVFLEWASPVCWGQASAGVAHEHPASRSGKKDLVQGDARESALSLGRFLWKILVRAHPGRGRREVRRVEPRAVGESAEPLKTPHSAKRREPVAQKRDRNTRRGTLASGPFPEHQRARRLVLFERDCHSQLAQASLPECAPSAASARQRLKLGYFQNVSLVFLSAGETVSVEHDGECFGKPRKTCFVC